MVDSSYCGNGILYSYNEGQLVYQGNFLNNYFSGYGTLYHSNGMKKYQGYFKNNNLDGEGVRYDYCGRDLCKCYFESNKILEYLLLEQDETTFKEILPYKTNEIVCQVEKYNAFMKRLCYSKADCLILDIDQYEGNLEKKMVKYNSMYEHTGYEKNFVNQYNYEIYIGEVTESDNSVVEEYRTRPYGYGEYWNLYPGQLLYKGYFSGDFMNGIKYYNDTVDHPVPHKIGHFIYRKMINHGASYFRNGKMQYRGVWKDNVLSKNKF